ncbi:MAG: hypothetical protein ABL927_13980, partial [Bdellovibrionales bacterium]
MEAQTAKVIDEVKSLNELKSLDDTQGGFSIWIEKVLDIIGASIVVLPLLAIAGTILYFGFMILASIG